MLGAGVQVYHTLKSRIETLIWHHFATPQLVTRLCQTNIPDFEKTWRIF